MIESVRDEMRKACEQSTLDQFGMTSKGRRGQGKREKVIKYQKRKKVLRVKKRS